MKKWADIEFDIGQEVFLKTDKDQYKRIVLTIWLLPTGVKYELGNGISASWHYGFEISDKVDVVQKVTYVQNND
jgi:hypothetical protein